MEYTKRPMAFAFTFPLEKHGHYYCTNETFDSFLEDKTSRLDDLTIAQWLDINQIKVTDSVTGKKLVK